MLASEAGCTRIWCAAGALGVLDGSAASRRSRARRPRRVLRRDLGLNYAGAILASELLDRIEELESGAPLRAANNEVTHGPEQADPEVPGGPARRADQGAALRPHRGGRRAPAARAARRAGRPDPAPAHAPGRRRGALRAALERQLEGRPRVSGPGGPGPGATSRGRYAAARRRRAGGAAAQGRVRLGRAPRARDGRDRRRDRRRAGSCASTASRASGCSRS